MKTLLLKTRSRRKTRIIYLHVELHREKGSPNWALEIRQKGHCTQWLDTGTSHEAAAREFASIMIRDVTNWMHQQPAASSQQPAASVNLI